MAVAHINAEDLINLFIAYVKKARRIPDRAFGEAEAGCHGFEFRVVSNDAPKLWRGRLEFELAETFSILCKEHSRERYQSGEYCHYCFHVSCYSSSGWCVSGGVEFGASLSR